MKVWTLEVSKCGSTSEGTFDGGKHVGSCHIIGPLGGRGRYLDLKNGIKKN